MDIAQVPDWQVKTTLQQTVQALDTELRSPRASAQVTQVFGTHNTADHHAPQLA